MCSKGEMDLVTGALKALNSQSAEGIEEGFAFDARQNVFLIKHGDIAGSRGRSKILETLASPGITVGNGYVVNAARGEIVAIPGGTILNGVVVGDNVLFLPMGSVPDQVMTLLRDDRGVPWPF